MPAKARQHLERAALSGARKGTVDIHLSDKDLINAVNATARDWAKDRAAEMVGMKYNEDGDLIPNPDARWRIDDTTREELRQIVTAGFEKETGLNEMIEQIANAGSFSDARAEMIARTEISFAQTTANYEAWEASGVVEKVQWILSEDHPDYDDCDLNDGEIVNLGDPFPSGHLAPPLHPHCFCQLIPVLE